MESGVGDRDGMVEGEEEKDCERGKERREKHSGNFNTIWAIPSLTSANPFSSCCSRCPCK